MSSDNLVGRTLQDGKYELREVIGRGGMATVYRAYANHLRTDVAVKVLAPHLAADLGFRARFQDEASSLAGLHHPNLLEVHWFGEENELIYILAHPSREAATKNWDAFRNDPEWQKVSKASEADGKIVEKVDSTFMDPTDFSKLK